MAQVTTLFDKSRDSFLSSFLLLITVAVCFSGHPKVFTSISNVASYELSFTLLFFLFKSGQPVSPPAKPGTIPMAFLSLFFLIIIYHALSHWLNAALFYELTLLKAAAITIHVLFFFCLSSFLLHSQYACKAICCALIGSSSFIAACYYGYALYLKVDGSFFLEGSLFAANIRHIGFIASLASLASLIALIEMCRARKRTISLLLTLLTAFNLSFVIWLGSRGGTLAVLLTSILILMLYNHRQRLPLQVIANVTAAAVIAVVISLQCSVYSWNGPGRIIAKLPAVTQNQSNTVAETTDFSSGRLALWHDTFERGRDKLWFGHGPESFFVVSPSTGKIDTFLHPHNSLLQVFFSTGIFGLISVIMLLLALLKHLNLKRIKCPDQQFPVVMIGLSLLTFLLLLSLTSGTLYFPQTLYFFACAIAFTTNHSETNRKMNSTNTTDETDPLSDQHLPNQIHSATPPKP